MTNSARDRLVRNRPVRDRTLHDRPAHGKRAGARVLLLHLRRKRGNHAHTCAGSCSGFRTGSCLASRARARRAASCSAFFLVVPIPLASESPTRPSAVRSRTSTWNRLRWSGPLSLSTRYTGTPAAPPASALAAPTYDRPRPRLRAVPAPDHPQPAPEYAYGQSGARFQRAIFPRMLFSRAIFSRVRSGIQIHRRNHRFHGVGQNRRLFPPAGAFFALAQPQVFAQPNRQGYLRHVAAAHQLRADAGQFSLLPIRMGLIQCLGDHHSPGQHPPETQAARYRRARPGLPPGQRHPACRPTPSPAHTPANGASAHASTARDAQICAQRRLQPGQIRGLGQNRLFHLFMVDAIPPRRDLCPRKQCLYFGAVILGEGDAGTLGTGLPSELSAPLSAPSPSASCPQL